MILLDVTMPGLSGFEVTRRLKQYSPQVKIIILTVHTDGPYPSGLLEAGADGYITKASETSQLITAIHAVVKGQRYIAPDIAQQLVLSRLAGSKRSPFSGIVRARNGSGADAD